MRRRSFISLITTCILFRNINLTFASEISDFNRLLASVSLQDILNAKMYKEVEAGRIFGVEAQGSLSGSRSDLTISERALNLITHFEISSESNYKKYLVKPMWPGGESGATCGIGFDLGYGDDNSIEKAWSAYLPAETVNTLKICAGITGVDARECTKQIQSAQVPWGAAMAQFKYYLPFVISQTHTAFKNLELLSPDSRGALVSLVYNRGSDVSKKKRRMEMYNISELMKNKQFEKIPDEILAMKKIWATDNLRGLLIRRELEADLFKIGLKNHEGKN